MLEEPLLPRVLEAPQHEPSQRAHRPRANRFVRRRREIIEHEAEARQIRADLRQQVRVDVEQVFERDRRAPAALAVVEDQRNDHGQLRGVRVLGEVRLPDPDHVAQEPEGHARVDRALVLEEHVDERRAAREERREEQIGVPPRKRFVHEAPGTELERGEIEARDERRWQRGAQLARDVVDLRERGLEEAVVRARRHWRRPACPRPEAFSMGYIVNEW